MTAQFVLTINFLTQAIIALFEIVQSVHRKFTRIDSKLLVALAVEFSFHVANLHFHYWINLKRWKFTILSFTGCFLTDVVFRHSHLFSSTTVHSSSTAHQLSTLESGFHPTESSWVVLAHHTWSTLAQETLIRKAQVVTLKPNYFHLVIDLAVNRALLLIRVILGSLQSSLW
jgi:hypothetical protein